MTKKALTIFLTALIFLSAVALGGSTVFRVDEVALSATVVSEQSKTDALQLKNELTSFYKGENIFSAKQTDAAEIIAQYPYFQVTEFKKSYPDKILIKVEEAAEVYAVENAEKGYYILSGSGTVLDVRSSYSNRLDKAENVLLKGLSVVGEKGGLLAGDDCWDSMFTFCGKVDEKLGGIRSNVVSAEVLVRSPETFYLITMREGVKIYVGNPSVMTEEKAKAAINKYMVLANEERMTGRLTVREVDGEIFVVYSPNDEFEY